MTTPTERTQQELQCQICWRISSRAELLKFHCCINGDYYCHGYRMLPLRAAKGA